MRNSVGGLPFTRRVERAAFRLGDTVCAMGWTGYLLLFGVGCVAGTLNVIAGGGSFLTLPALMFLGLPAGLANGTNRVGILLQNIGAVWGFDREGVMDRSALLWATLPATAGGALGAFTALAISDQLFKRILALLMVGLSLWSLWAPKRSKESASSPASRLFIGIGFFFVGIYGGFVQAGVGFLVLAVTTAAGLDLVRGNAVKVLSILGVTALSLAIFAFNDRVDWPLGLALGAGTIVGSQIGVRLTIAKGDRWLRTAVTTMVILFAVKLWIDS